MDRIQINGEWYVKEKLTNKPTQTIDWDKDAIFTKGFLYENDELSLEATLITDNNGDALYLNTVSIDVTDKRKNDRILWVKDYWDNTTFLLNLADGNQDSINEIKHLFSGEGLEITQQFIKQIMEMGWVTEEK